jgi:hypothetical protein
MMDYESIKHLVVDHRGIRLTVGLFEELNDGTSAVKPCFKLSDWRKVYVAAGDPTGYKAAMELLGDWEHWLLIIKSPSFSPHLEQWNKELEVKLRSEAVAQLVKQSKLPTGTAAAKWLADSGFTSKVDKRKKQAEEPGKVRENISEDAARLGLVRVK